MKIISSQRYVDFDIVDSKTEMLAGKENVTLPVYDAKMQDLDGNDLFVLADGHHTYQAAKELEISIEFEIVNYMENLTGEDLLEACWMDSDWYYIDTEINVW